MRLKKVEKPGRLQYEKISIPSTVILVLVILITVFPFYIKHGFLQPALFLFSFLLLLPLFHASLIIGKKIELDVLHRLVVFFFTFFLGKSVVCNYIDAPYEKLHVDDLFIKLRCSLYKSPGG